MLVVGEKGSTLESMSSKAKLITSLIILAVAGTLAFNFFRTHREPEPLAYFYDLSEQKLFTARQDSVPPIIGTDGKVADAVRAVVYSPSGDCEKDQKIAYLEKYSAELKQQFEAAKADPNREFARMSRGAAQAHTFVSRVSETNWFAINTQEGERIIDEWRFAHPGKDPTICIP
jgi:hypothetical protein